jgi:hypothetical protein
VLLLIKERQPEWSYCRRVLLRKRAPVRELLLLRRAELLPKRANAMKMRSYSTSQAKASYEI